MPEKAIWHLMQETTWAAGALPQTPLEELTMLADKGASCPLFKNITPTLGISGLACPRPLIFKPPPN